MTDSEFTTTCPMCGELVTHEDLECRYCGESLGDPQESDPLFDSRMIRRFHGEAWGLGAFWLVVGLASVTGGWWLLNSGLKKWTVYSSRESLVLPATGAVISGGVWIWCGVMTVRKNLQAVRIGLWVGYLNALIHLTFLNVPGILVLFVGILRALRVLKHGLLLQETGLLESPQKE